MSFTDYTPSATWHTAPFKLHDDGETVNHATLMYNAAAAYGLIAKLYDRTEYLKGSPTIVALTTTGAVQVGTTLGVTGAATMSSTLGVTGAVVCSSTLGVTGAISGSSTITSTADVTAGSDGSGSFKLGSRSVTRSTGGIMYLQSAGTFSSNGAVTVPANDIGDMMVDLPHGATLTKMSFGVNPTNASPPAGTKVVGAVFKRAIATGATTTIVSTTDPTTGTDYGNAHSFDTATVSEVIDRTTYRYYVNLTGETGGGADTCAWYGCTWTANVTGIDDGVS